MATTKESNDVFAATVPTELDPSQAAQEPAINTWLDWLDQVAREWVWAQWASAGERPIEITFAASEWLITRDVWRLDEFQPVHDCQECRAGNEKSKAFLRANPGRWLAMANMTYTEVWP